MSNKICHIYLLTSYANTANLQKIRHATEHESRIEYTSDSLKIALTETTSLVEQRYSLNLHSARFIIESSIPYNEIKEAMIHHHPTGHPGKHLQFKLIGKNEVIRIK